MRQYVGVVLVKADGSVLAQHRDNNPAILGGNLWSLVGGTCEEDESLKNAAARELLEETGYVISEKGLIFLACDEYVTEKGVPVQRNMFWAKYDGKQPINCYEGQEIRFVGKEELETLEIYNNHKDFLQKASEQISNYKNKDG